MIRRLKQLIRTMFLVVPCRMHMSGVARRGGVSLVVLFWMVAIAATAGVAGAGWAFIFGTSFSDHFAFFQGASVSDHFFIGALGGLALYLVWTAYWGAVIVVLWVRGVAPDAIVAAHSMTNADPVLTGHPVPPAAPMNWRRPGQDPLVPGWLVSMLAFMSVMTAVSLSRADGPIDRDLEVWALRVLLLLLVASGIGCVVGRHRHGSDLLSGRDTP